jgi:hypothetical protein
MFVASRGRGFLIAIVTVVSLSLCDFLTAQHFNDLNYYAHNGWPKLTAFWVAAAVVQLMLPRKPDKVLGQIHPAPEKPSLLRYQDSLFLIPARYWPWALFALGIAFYFVNF